MYLYETRTEEFPALAVHLHWMHGTPTVDVVDSVRGGDPLPVDITQVDSKPLYTQRLPVDTNHVSLNGIRFADGQTFPMNVTQVASEAVRHANTTTDPPTQLGVSALVTAQNQSFEAFEEQILELTSTVASLAEVVDAMRDAQQSQMNALAKVLEPLVATSLAVSK